MVEKPERAQIIMNDPYEGVRQGWRTYFTHVPGILFTLSLGKTVSEEIQALSITKIRRIDGGLTAKVPQDSGILAGETKS